MKKPVSQTWDLDVFFPGGSSSSEFANFLQQCKENIVQFQKQIKELQVPKSLEETRSLVEVINVMQKIEADLMESLAFVECLTAQNTKDEKAQLLFGQVTEYFANYQAALIDLDRLFMEIPQAIWEQFVQSETCKPIAFPLNERRQKSLEKLPSEQEVLANDLAISGYHAWSELYSKVVGRISIPVEKDGQVEHLSVGQAYNLFSHEDREVRQDVYEKWLQAWGKESDFCAHTLNHLGGFRLNLYRHRGWDSVLKEPLDINRMSEETLQTMWQVVDQNKDLLVQYLDRKAKLLNVPKLSWYDLSAPVGKDGMKISYDEAADMIVEQFKRFSPKMADFAVKAFEERWIEAEDRQGKRPGGFCTGFSVSDQSRIFMTYSDTMDNASTLAHELGHAYHSYVMNDMPELAKNYAMNVAETASTFAEKIVADAAVQQAKSKDEKIALLDNNAQSAVAFLMNIHSRFLFETEFYERRKQGALSVEELKELTLKSQKKAYLDALDSYEPYFWASKGHFYITEVPFYNYPYTFGYLFSCGVYARALQEGASFEDKYIALLRDTASMTVEDLAQKHLGADLTRPDFWQSAVDLALADVQEFLNLTE